MVKYRVLKNEDYLAIWIGAFFILVGLFLLLTSGYQTYRNAHSHFEKILSFEGSQAPFNTVTWYQTQQKQSKLKAENSPAGKVLGKLTEKLERWSDNPLQAIYLSKTRAMDLSSRHLDQYEKAQKAEANAFATAVEAENEARDANFENEQLNRQAREKIDQCAHGSKSWIL